MNQFSSMLSDSITTLLCMMEDPLHPFNQFIYKNKPFYMDSISPDYTIRTTFQCISNRLLEDRTSHQEVLYHYLNLLIKARFLCFDSKYEDSIYLNQCQYKICISCIH